MKRKLAVIFLIVIYFFSCEQEERVNPFDNVDSTQDTVRLQVTEFDSSTIAGLYANVFKPTCANVGCHDGSFEPDYRTIESSYNTMVYQAPIKNDGSYDYRVHPGDADKSVLLARLTGKITPLMPFQLEPDSDWSINSNRYIEQITEWIDNGAPDILGQIPERSNPKPRMTGVRAISDGEWLTRSGSNGHIRVPNGVDEIVIYFAFDHDHVNPVDFTYNKIALNNNPNSFEEPLIFDLNVLTGDNTVLERGFHGNIVEFTHSVSIQTRNLFAPEVTHIFFRAYIQDDNPHPTEIPTDNGIYYIKNYMSFRLQ